MKNYIFPFLWMRGEPEEVIREEMSRIDACGIGAVCLEARPHKDFCGPGWWHDLDIVIDEAVCRGMKIWILDDRHFPTGYANGLLDTKYPERRKKYLACSVCDIFGEKRPHTLNVRRMMKPTIGFWQIGQLVDEEERKNNRLLAVLAVRFAEGRYFHEEALDLTDQYKGGDNLTFTLPEGQWRIHVLYTTRTDGGNPSYINMIDAVSAHTQIEGVYEEHYKRYGDLFGPVIAGFFSDEPQFGNTNSQNSETRLGQPGMQLPWSQELEEMLRDRYGTSCQKALPFLFAEGEERELTPQIRYDYMDCVSRLYERDFSKTIGDWCHAHGVEYIGHVVEDNSVHSRLGLGAGHWFRAMAGQDMAGIDAIGGQVVFGAPLEERTGMGDLRMDGEFFHYTLGKLGASAGHLDPKKGGRTMCELFGAYGWNFGVRDQKRLMDHLLVRGVNHLVPHAFSMAEYPDADCPPHFYTRGNNPEFPFFAELMKYGNRMCELLNDGRHVASVAVLYDGEADWAGDRMPMQKVCRTLMENQIDFDIVSLDMLSDLPAVNGSLENGVLTIQDVSFHALLIPGAAYLPEKLLTFAQQDPTFEIWFADQLPERLLMDERREAPKGDSWKSRFRVLPLKELANQIRVRGWNRLSAEPAFPRLEIYEYVRNGAGLVMLHNASAEQSFEGDLTLPFKEAPVLYDGMGDEVFTLKPRRTAEGCMVTIALDPGESCILAERKALIAENCALKESGGWKPLKAREKEAERVLDISEGWDVSAVRAKTYPAYPAEDHIAGLKPYSEDHPDFSGMIRYRKQIQLEQEPDSALLEVDHVFDVMRVRVNGQKIACRLTPPYAVDLGPLLHAGENELEIEVATTPGREQNRYPAAPFDFTYEASDPTGMYGRIRLYLFPKK